jgi:hypothetical protein
MTAREALVEILEKLPDERVSQLLDYARFLTLQQEDFAWRDFGKLQLAKAYGNDEPEYTEADLRKVLPQ